VTKEFPVKGFVETEIRPASAWNYGLLLENGSLENNISVVKSAMPANPYVQEDTPIKLKLKAKRIPGWTIDYNGASAFDVPFSPVASKEKEEEITLVPFGSETLRLSIFPTIGRPWFINQSYQENFDDNTFPGMVIYGGGWFCKDGAVHTAVNEDGKSGNGTKLLATGTRFANFEYSANVTVNTAGDAGLMFRVTDPAIGAYLYKGYYVGLNAETGTIELGKAVNKQWKVIKSAKLPLVLKKAYKVTVRAVDDKISVYIDDAQIPVISAIDAEYKTGNIGIRAYNALATVDNLVVEAL
ncbi:MAG: DUF1080 domain-containing protein, partial [Sphingobacteriaceae bacterium]